MGKKDECRIRLPKHFLKYSDNLKDMTEADLDQLFLGIQQGDGIEDKLRKTCKLNRKYNIGLVANQLDTTIKDVTKGLQKLSEIGLNAIVDGDFFEISSLIPKSAPTIIDISKTKERTFRFGAVGDNHLCSKYERMDVLNSLYEYFKDEGITKVYNTGNWIDGEARFNKHDLIVHGFDNQLKYMVENYPQVEGIDTYYISGDDHEGWYTQKFGINCGLRLQQDAQAAGRNDLHFLGHMEADIVLKAPHGETVIRVLHPGGGSAYALSYSVQKIVESYQGGEKPHILLVGHYHKAEYSYVRGVHCVQTGCTQDQTPFMRKKKLAAHLGGWIIEFSVDDNGAVTRFKQEFIPFYNNDYYKKWHYRW